MKKGISKEIWVAIIGSITAITVGVIQLRTKETKEIKTNNEISHTIIKENVFAGAVVDEESNNSIQGAIITIVGKDKTYVSENNGNFRINFDDTILKEVRIRVDKRGYISYDKSFDLPNESAIIQLKKNN